MTKIKPALKGVTAVTAKATAVKTVLIHNMIFRRRYV